MVPYEVTGGAEDYVKIKVRDKDYTPEQISSVHPRQDLKKTAEDYLGEKVTEAVITVPAYFNDAQRQATKDAGEIAGLKVLRVLPEPTAAAVAYGIDRKKNEKVLVFDLGGGTFDVSVLESTNDEEGQVFSVESINGDTHLGGDDFDEELINFLAEEFRKQEGIDLRKDPMALQRLKEAAEKAKIELSSAMETTVNLPFITADGSGPKHLNLTITRSKFENLVGRPGRADEKAGARRPQGRRPQAGRGRRDHPRRRLHPHPAGAEGRQGAFQRQGAQQERQPRRGRRPGRGHPGRHRQGRRQGHPCPRRHARLASAWRRSAA